MAAAGPFGMMAGMNARMTAVVVAVVAVRIDR